MGPMMGGMMALGWLLAALVIVLLVIIVVLLARGTRRL